MEKDGSKLNTPVKNFDLDNNDENSDPTSAKGEKRRKDSELVIVEFKNNERSIEKQ